MSAERKSPIDIDGIGRLGPDRPGLFWLADPYITRTFGHPFCRMLGAGRHCLDRADSGDIAITISESACHRIIGYVQPLFLVTFAATHILIEYRHAGSYSQPMTRLDAFVLCNHGIHDSGFRRYHANLRTGQARDATADGRKPHPDRLGGPILLVRWSAPQKPHRPNAELSPAVAAARHTRSRHLTAVQQASPTVADSDDLDGWARRSPGGPASTPGGKRLLLPLRPSLDRRPLNQRNRQAAPRKGSESTRSPLRTGGEAR